MWIIQPELSAAARAVFARWSAGHPTGRSPTGGTEPDRYVAGKMPALHTEVGWFRSLTLAFSSVFAFSPAVAYSPVSAFSAGLAFSSASALSPAAPSSPIRPARRSK